MDVSRRSFLMGAAATVAASGCRSFGMPTTDENLSVFISDLHVRDAECFQYRYLQRTVDDILAMNPRPKRVICFGDIAYTCGLRKEYQTSRPLLQKLVDAGIELTFGMGNHDRRSAFLETWPEYRGKTLFPGRIVTSVNLGPVDLLMLDGLQGTDDRAENDMGPVPGKLDEPQQEWLLAYLKKLTRKTFLASHYPVSELQVCGKPLSRLIGETPLVAGYIHGHDHRWQNEWEHFGWGMQGIYRRLCLPSTGHWGDIGYTTFRVSEHEAVAEFVQKDFFFGWPTKEGEVRPAAWDDLLAEHRDCRCTFRY